MKLWTAQSISILETISAEGVYKPNFNLSRYLMTSGEFSALYNKVLESFNAINALDCEGVAFCFAVSDNQAVFEISDFKEFFEMVQKGKPAIESLWNNLCNRADTAIFELEYPTIGLDPIILETSYGEPFRPFFIDINDFQYLMPPFIELPNFPHGYEWVLLKSLEEGRTMVSPFPSHVMQAHVPSITEKNIVDIYKPFGFT